MRLMALPLVASIGLLSACDSQQPAGPLQDGPSTASAEASEQPDAAQAEAGRTMAGPEGSTTPTPTPTESDTPAAEPTLFNLPDVPAGDVAEDRAALTAIPARFLGQWDAPDGPCTPDSEMFMTIRPGTITFYESQGEVSAVRRGKPGIVVRLEMQGEGESWTSEYGMALVRNSEQLATRELSGSGTGTIRRRCPPAANTTGANTTEPSAS